MWHPVWEQRLKTVQRGPAQVLIPKLTKTTPLGYELPQSKTSLVSEANDWKAEQGSRILLVRVGEFYESWGLDAVMFVAVFSFFFFFFFWAGGVRRG